MEKKITIPLPESFTPEKAEEIFIYITQIFDLLDNVTSAISNENLENADLQYQITAPFVKQVADSTNMLSRYYTEFTKKGRPLTPELKSAFESNIRDIFVAIKELTDAIEDKLLLTDAKD